MEILHHTIEHTFPMIPVLFVTYLILEMMEQKHWTPQFLSHSHIAPVLAALTSLIPQCGLPALYANLYAARLITTGTLIASFISCSDEMLPLLISSKVPIAEIFLILLIKFLAGVIFGFIFHMNAKPLKTDIAKLCHKENSGCKSNIFKSALVHTLKMAWTLLIVTFVLEYIMHDTEYLIKHLMDSPDLIKLLLSVLIGLIPNCASSIILTQLYLSDVLPFAAMIAGLCANAGTGMIVLTHVNPEKKDTIRILMILSICSLITGLILIFIEEAAFLQLFLMDQSLLEFFLFLPLH